MAKSGRKREAVFWTIVLAFFFVWMIFWPSMLNGIIESFGFVVDEESYGWLGVFPLFTAITLVPAVAHARYSGDYRRLSREEIMSYALFAGFWGALVGEIIPHLNMFPFILFMVLPYTVFALLYGWLYSKFSWWLVAMTAPFFGMTTEFLFSPRHKLPFFVVLFGLEPTEGWATTLTFLTIFATPFFLWRLMGGSRKRRFMSLVNRFSWLIWSLVGLFLLVVVFYLVMGGAARWWEIIRRMYFGLYY